MRVAILTQYYPPEAGAPQRRLSDLAARLASRGHTVQVLTALPNYPGERIFPAYAGRENSIEHHGPVRVARVGLYVPPFRKTTAQRLRCYFSFAGNAARAGRKLLQPADVIFMESPPLTLAPAGVFLSRTLEAPLVTNVSDVWPQSAVELGMLAPGLMLRAAEALERWTYRRSAALTGQTEGIVAHLRAKAPQKPIHFFPNGVDLQAYSESADSGRVRDRFGWLPEEFVAGYTGLFGHAQALGQLIDAARLLTPADRIRIVLFGDGPCREALQAQADAAGSMPWLSIHGPQPPDDMPAIQAALDAGLVPLANKPIFEGARPSKMFEVMAAARPVVLCGSGEAARLIQAAPGGPAGVAVPPESPADLAGALRRLARDRAAGVTMGRAGRRMVEETFDREKITAGVEAFLMRVSRHA